MATSSISAEVKAANSKLADFLRSQEDEEALLQIGKRKLKMVHEERLPSGKGRWLIEPDWKAPTPLVDRPRTSGGATSFHFSFLTISKQVVPTVGGKPVFGLLGKDRSPAVEHSKYIERDGAAERYRGAHHALYIEREGAAELRGNDPPSKGEFDHLDAHEGTLSIFSNISDDAFERQEFWRAVERHESTPRTHQIIMEPDICLGWWAELVVTTKLDPEFQSHALEVAEACRDHMARPLGKGEARKPFTAKPMKVTTESAGRFFQQAQRMANYDDARPPFEFKSGRGGRIQFRIVAELPHELSPEDRALIVQNFCDHLATLEERKDPDGHSYRTGLMYTAVIHAPDGHNDARNYHLHVIAYDRPCRFFPEHGQWDFEVEQRYNHKGEDRVRYPFRQNKIGEVSQGTSKTGKEKSGKDFIPGLRAKFAEINNAVLKARGVKRHLDPRKYTEMGIDRTPTEHLGTKAAALEAVGVPTAVGQLNAIAIWSDAERAIRRQAVQSGKVYQATQSELESIATLMTARDPSHPAMMQFRRLTAERERLIKDVAEDRESLMIFDHLEAKAKSRAIRTQRTCMQCLSDIETGKADRNTTLLKIVIQARWKGLQEHIAKIDQALQQHREPLAKAARDIEQRERRILEIDTEIIPVRALLEKRLAEQAHSSRTGKPKASPAAQRPAVPTSTIVPPALERKQAEAATGRLPGDEPAAIGRGSETGIEAGPTSSAVEPNVPATEASNATPTAPNVAANQPTVVVAEPAPAHAENAQEVKDLEPTHTTDPVSISGLPIVEPTIAPRQDIPVEEVEIEAGTPAGLQPLRPAEIIQPVAANLEVVIADVENPEAEVTPTLAEQPQIAAEPAPVAAEPVAANQPADAHPQALEAPAPAEPNTVPETVEATAAPEPTAPAEIVTKGPTPPAGEPTPVVANLEAPFATPPVSTVDGSKKVRAWMLPELSNQEPSVKPSTSKATDAEFDAIIERVMAERTPITPEKRANGAVRFTVPALPQDQQDTLSNPKFAHRANKRLGAIMDKQNQEVHRVIRWIATQGQDPDNLSFRNRTASLGTNVKVSVRTLFRHWGKHPEVTAALRGEYNRRIELEKSKPIAKPQPAKAEADFAERRAEAEKIYPDPSQAFTPEVAEFCRLLRALAPDDQLREAADKIYENPRAREDIMKHTVYLATAYHTHVEGRDRRLQQQQLRYNRIRSR